jgi:hypothetical protein
VRLIKAAAYFEHPSALRARVVIERHGQSIPILALMVNDC